MLTYFSVNPLNSAWTDSTEFHSTYRQWCLGYHQHHSVKHLNFSCWMMVCWHFLCCASFCCYSSPSELAFHAIMCPLSLSALVLQNFQFSHQQTPRKCYSQRYYFKYAPNPLSAGASPQTPLGELTALPQTPQLHLRGPTSKGRDGKEEEGKGVEGR